jgi:hypothetical protein
VRRFHLQVLVGSGITQLQCLMEYLFRKSFQVVAGLAAISRPSVCLRTNPESFKAASLRHLTHLRVDYIPASRNLYCSRTEGLANAQLQRANSTRHVGPRPCHLAGGLQGAYRCTLSMTRFLYPARNDTLFARMEEHGEGHYPSSIGSEQFLCNFQVRVSFSGPHTNRACECLSAQIWG